MKKYNFTIVVLSLFFHMQLIGQSEFRISFNNTQDRKVEIYSNNMDITVSAYDGSEVVIETSGLEPLPERAVGLKSLSRDAIDNTGLGLDVSKSDNNIVIKQATKSELQCFIKIPRTVNLLISENSWQGEEITVNELAGEIEIKSKGSDVNINNILGPVVAHSTGGDITVIFSKVSQKGPSSISSTSGFVDITLPANTPANLNLNSTSGDIYTDLDIVFEEKEKKEDIKKTIKFKLKETAKGVNWQSWEDDCGSCGKKIKGTINNGGVDLFIKSISDDVFIRKAK